MEHVVKIEVTIDGNAARLYQILSEAVGSTEPRVLNRALLQTGLVHHVLMLKAIGGIEGRPADAAEDAIDEISADSIMDEVFELARDYWEKKSGSTGTIFLGD